MADNSAPETRSKRKRARVNYYEGTSDFSDIEDIEYAENSEGVVATKKRKTAPPKPTKLPPRKTFPFLTLPAEIRNEIYAYCLHDPAGIFLYSTTKMYRRTVCRVSEVAFRGQPAADDTEQQSSPLVRKLVPALLAVCKQIHAEARDILYAHEFHVKDTLALHSFLVDLGPRAAPHLKSVVLAEWGEGTGVHKAYNHAVFTALITATNLQHFTFHGFLTNHKDAKSRAISFYRDAFPWLEAVAAARNSTDAALDLLHVLVAAPVSSTTPGYPYYLSRHRRRMFGPKPKYEAYADVDDWRQELGKLLGDRMDKVRS